MTDLTKMTGKEHDKFMNMIARYIGTRKSFLTLDTITPLSDGKADVRVIYRGGYIYRFIVANGEVILTCFREVRRA